MATDQPNLPELESLRLVELQVLIRAAEECEADLLRAVRAGRGGEQSLAAFHAAQLQRQFREALLEELFLRRRLEELSDRRFQLCAEIIRSGAV
jgi:hypothetical protein